MYHLWCNNNSHNLNEYYINLWNVWQTSNKSYLGTEMFYIEDLSTEGSVIDPRGWIRL